MEELNEDSGEYKIFNLVMMNFFASLSVDAKYKSVTTSFNVKGKIFKETHKELVEEGFIEFIGPDLLSSEIMVFENYSFRKNQTINIERKLVKKCQTAPKEFLSESELIQMMEINRVGTDGTIPKHIKKIVERKYVEVKEIGGVRRFIPTPIGEILAEGYLEIDEELVNPSVRAFIESCCNKISYHKKDNEAVVNKAIEIFERKLENLISNFSKIEKKLKNLHKIVKEKESSLEIINQYERSRVGGIYVLYSEVI